jgi:outer membrane protein OmpA-like peptidoglycan-associated protein
LRIAQSEGAEKYASDSYQRAVKLMNDADAYAIDKNIQKKQLIAVAREAVQTAEDARAIAVKRIDEERQANERQASAEAATKSQLQVESASREKEQAQSDAAKAQLAKAQAESDTAKARREAADAEYQTAQARSDMADSQASSASALAAAQADAEQSRLAAQQAEQSAQQRAQQAEADKAALRARLSEQLNSILQTRDSARGLIVSMSDVLFDTGKYSLKSGAREKLAKVAGILLAYPGLNIEVGGYTDNVGGDAMNQKLSENRATSVRDYLVQQGVATNSVTTKGFGNSSPVASNNNSAGRQQNRRVELLVSGEAIGQPVNGTTGGLH